MIMIRKTLIDSYREWVHKMRASNKPTLSYVCPDCGSNLLTGRLPKGVTYTSIAECPYCHAVFGYEMDHATICVKGVNAVGHSAPASKVSESDGFIKDLDHMVNSLNGVSFALKRGMCEFSTMATMVSAGDALIMPECVDMWLKICKRVIRVQKDIKSVSETVKHIDSEIGMIGLRATLHHNRNNKFTNEDK